ncbi:CapA family protein [Paenibacillus sp. MBLB4367]|uniref:CapA family protein n=1 Tax=Paenibacillus sp. MBLB4367 TaxID=3384767 RepID=UPI003907FCA4
MERSRKTMCSAVLVLFGLMLAGCGGGQSPSGTPSPTSLSQSAGPPETQQPTQAPTPSSAPPLPSPSPLPSPAPVVHSVTFSAIGDILIHNTVYQDASKPDGSYDFKPMLKEVKDLLERSDIAIANQETVIGGSELGLSSYPLFNSPHEVGDALASIGISLVTTANNHAMDMGEKGIVSAAAHWRKIGMPYTGTFVSQEDRDTIRTLTKNDITFAFLAYTYGTNGIPVPRDKPYLVNLLDEDTIKRDIEEARKKADVVVVSPHWGEENETVPSEAQKALARRLADWGADIIVGTHPHVLQPIVWLPREDGKRSLVMYSLGNFLSAQDQVRQLIGGIAQIRVIKTTDSAGSSIELKDPAFIPTYNKYENFRRYQVIPIHLVSEEDAKRLAPHWKRIKESMLSSLPELTIVD